MKTTFLKTALLIFITTMFSCEDNTNTNDSTGNDSFSCYINGKLYIPSAGTGIGSGDIRPFAWSYTNLDNPNIPYFFSIGSSGEYTISLVKVNPILGENILNQELVDIIDFSHSGMIVLNSIIDYNTKNNQDNGTIIFTEFSETKAVGTFECILYNDNGDELKVTNGKFNLSLDSKKN
jgi:hypothetical protein